MLAVVAMLAMSGCLTECQAIGLGAVGGTGSGVAVNPYTCTNTAVTACPANKICRVAIHGDSMSQEPYSPNTPWSTRLRTSLETALGDTCVLVDNFATSGDETADQLADWNNTARARSPDIVITWIGVNDIANGDGAGTDEIDAAETNIDEIHDEAQADGAYVINLGGTPFKNNTFGWWSAGRQTQMDSWLTARAAASNVDVYLDAYGTLESASVADQIDDDKDRGDLLHPNNTGYVDILELVEGALY